VHTHPSADQSVADQRARPPVHGRQAATHMVSAVIRVEPAAVEWLEALVEGDDVFAARFAIGVVDGWAGFPEAVPHILAGVREEPDQAWGAHLFFDDDGALVGLGGWKGAPVHGAAELGYAVAPARQGRGIATAVVAELVARAAAAGVTTVVAHTLAEPNASTTVLERSGFTRAAEVIDPDEGPVWRWERSLP
jgi:ribosomal-protein-alanine N-acetyltransferase